MLRKGVNATFIRLALGVDGIYEIYLEGASLPDGGAHPLVPVEDE
jgi:hypothetical protein